ncbi:hypothetical protein [Flavobacterium sp. N1718]|uniref:hypothetical protein n=1 Tax=Flavobacterium sp. N1718 TaxID=2986822 RepID=UPI0022241EAB|nr:hypothetical protein [Flavobacterium sp. N1718]
MVPINIGTNVVITLTNDQDSNCVVNSAALTQIACPPSNDECNNPLELTVNPDYNCGTVTQGSLAGATASAVSNGGTGNPDDDVWFSFVATETSHRVSILNVTGTPTDMVHEVLSGDCSGLTSVSHQRCKHKQPVWTGSWKHLLCSRIQLCNGRYP